MTKPLGTAVILPVYCFFFLKQKTAYEIRPRDWSSDVCSSDLVSKSKHDTNGFETGHWSIGFTEIDTFDLGVTLCYQSGLVSYHNTILILLVAEYPFSANNIMLRGIRSFNERPHFVSLKLMKLFHHSQQPIWILHSFIKL